MCFIVTVSGRARAVAEAVEAEVAVQAQALEEVVVEESGEEERRAYGW